MDPEVDVNKSMPLSMSQDYLAREDQRRVSSQEQARLKMNVQEEGDTDGEQRLDDDIAILERKDGIEV